MTYRATKTWGHEQGLSCAFRQWRARSHCHFVHGYALAVSVTFEAKEVDERGWVVDFGGLKGLKGSIADLFDHKTVIAQDDPQKEWFEAAHRSGIVDLVVLGGVGCEYFARLVADIAANWLHSNNYGDRVKVANVTISEHGANSAVFIP